MKLGLIPPCFLLSNVIILINAEVTPRIVGGSDAGSYPFFIRLGGCGATLIHGDIALGAAHCSGESVAHVGTSVRSAEGDGSIGTTVSQRSSHPNFDRSTYAYDFVVMKLDAWINKTTVKLSSSSPSAGDSLTILGFGLTEEGGENSDTLQEGQIRYIDTDECANIFAGENEVLPDVMLCAGGDAVDACAGDSGGPLLDGGEQIGIISWGIGCGRIGVPGVYSRISGARSWIEEQVCTMSEYPPRSCYENDEARSDFVRLDVYYDEFPNDTSWSIRRSSGEVVQSSSRQSVRNVMISTYIDIDDGDYVFEIADDFGDGFGEGGKYELYWEAKDVIISGSDGIGYGRQVNFTVGIPPERTVQSVNPTVLATSPPSATGSRSPTLKPTTSAPTFEPTVLLSPVAESTRMPTERPIASPTSEPKEPFTPKPTLRSTSEPSAPATPNSNPSPPSPPQRFTPNPVAIPTPKATALPTPKPIALTSAPTAPTGAGPSEPSTPRPTPPPVSLSQPEPEPTEA